jgi:hypothetical protein
MTVGELKRLTGQVIYSTYLQIGVSGLRALSSFKVEDQAWGGDHDQVSLSNVISKISVTANL